MQAMANSPRISIEFETICRNGVGDYDMLHENALTLLATPSAQKQSLQIVRTDLCIVRSLRISTPLNLTETRLVITFLAIFRLSSFL